MARRDRSLKQRRGAPSRNLERPIRVHPVPGAFDRPRQWIERLVWLDPSRHPVPQSRAPL